jgi:hypothetical protein
LVALVAIKLVKLLGILLVLDQEPLLVGAIAGSVLGGLFGFTSQTGAYINRNKRFISESPYVGTRRLSRDTMNYGGGLYQSGAKNKSLDTAADLNADGNIVLGMHNLRRGG